MPTKSELTSLETVINRLIRYVKRSNKYKDDSALINALTPSEEKLFIAEGKTLEHLFDDYLAKHLSMTEIEMKTLCKDFMRSSGGTLEPLPPEVMGVVADYLPAKDEGRLSVTPNHVIPSAARDLLSDGRHKIKIAIYMYFIINSLKFIIKITKIMLIFKIIWKSHHAWFNGCSQY
ncbi:MAG: hypothetical protein NTW08_02760 [Gammaproteobacteria bacterium]|nr:hypothetical protein [Gammaproteobacteria bacterium]